MSTSTAESDIRLSLNQATTRPHSLRDTVEAAVAAGIGAIGLWREPVERLGVAATRRLLDDTGLTVSSVCREGFVADKSGPTLRTALDEVRRALELCHRVGSPMLTFIAGGLPAGNRSLRSAEDRVRDALAELAPFAAASGVRLALEPLHPLFAADRSVVSTIAAALRVVEPLPSASVGILIDAYATWWDPDFASSVAAAGDRIAGFQVSDFALPLPVPENMNGRLFPGDGVLDFGPLVDAVRGAGFTGPVEVEIFNDDIWRLPLRTVIERTVTSFAEHVQAAATPLPAPRRTR